MHDVTWGLDVSTNRVKTAAVALDWSTPGEARVVDVLRPPCSRDCTADLSQQGEQVGRRRPLRVAGPVRCLDEGPPRRTSAGRGRARSSSGLGELADSADRTTTHRPVSYRRPADQDPPTTCVISDARRDGRDVGVGRSTAGLSRGPDRPRGSPGHGMRNLSVGGSIGLGLRAGEADVASVANQLSVPHRRRPPVQPVRQRRRLRRPRMCTCCPGPRPRTHHRSA